MTYYWKQTWWNQYTLRGNGNVMEFPSYDALYKYCAKNGIDAKQV